MPVITAGTLNAVADVNEPIGVVTWMSEFSGASGGTVAVIFESELTTKEAETPPKVTLVAPESALPLIVTVVPTGPEVGEKLAIPGVFTAAAQFHVLHSEPAVHIDVSHTRPVAAVVSAAGSGDAAA